MGRGLIDPLHKWTLPFVAFLNCACIYIILTTLRGESGYLLKQGEPMPTHHHTILNIRVRTQMGVSVKPWNPLEMVFREGREGRRRGGE